MDLKTFYEILKKYRYQIFNGNSPVSYSQLVMNQFAGNDIFFTPLKIVPLVNRDQFVIHGFVEYFGTYTMTMAIIDTEVTAM